MIVNNNIKNVENFFTSYYNMFKGKKGTINGWT